jgi:hypothetical protein
MSNETRQAIAREAREHIAKLGITFGPMWNKDVESFIIAAIDKALHQAEHGARLAFASSDSNDFVLCDKMFRAITEPAAQSQRSEHDLSQPDYLEHPPTIATDGTGDFEQTAKLIISAMPEREQLPATDAKGKAIIDDRIYTKGGDATWMSKTNTEHPSNAAPIVQPDGAATDDKQEWRADADGTLWIDGSPYYIGNCAGRIAFAHNEALEKAKE